MGPCGRGAAEDGKLSLLTHFGHWAAAVAAAVLLLSSLLLLPQNQEFFAEEAQDERYETESEPEDRFDADFLESVRALCLCLCVCAVGGGGRVVCGVGVGVQAPVFVCGVWGRI